MSTFDDVIHTCQVRLRMTETDGTSVISSLVQEAAKNGLLAKSNVPKAIRSVLKREMSASTSLPDGIALPHARTDCVNDIAGVIGIHPQGIAFGAPDNRPTHIFVLLLVPLTKGCSHIEFLAQLSRCLMEPSVRTSLMNADSREDVVKAILTYVDEGSL